MPVSKSLEQVVSPAVTQEQVSAGLRAFFNIADKWDIKPEQAMVLLGQPARATYYKWKKDGFHGRSSALDLATRIGYVLGIFRALEILYLTPQLADRWVTQPNAAFGGQSALDRMMAGQITDLAAVRDYLDSVRGGW